MLKIHIEILYVPCNICPAVYVCIYIYIHTVYIPRPASWVKFIPPAEAKEMIVASTISAVSAKKLLFQSVSTVWQKFWAGQLPFLHLS